MDMESQSSRSTRIAKNTLLLYCRMLFLLLVGLYTSRVVLAALGIDDFGIYSAVGGVVAMFAVISGALSAAISRFLTFELGRKESGAQDRMGAIFAASVKTQLIIAAAIVLLAEPLGLWFLGSKMNIPVERLGAARWVFQFSLLTFVINMISVPYNAAIIAHEKMRAFAVIGIGEGLAKLAVALLIAFAAMDGLIFYAMLMAVVAVLVRLSYGIYCRRSFEECREGIFVRGRSDDTRGVMKQMFSFAGWNFIGASSAVLRDQGGSVLLNLFGGPAVNAARGVALQLSGAVQGFVTNFMTAMNPQITKSYAAEDREYTTRLVFKGARLSFMLLLVLSMPLMLNMDFILDIWLKEVPGHAAAFACLAMIFALSESLSNPLVTLQLATGKIRNYQILVGGIQLLNLPVAWICLKTGSAPECVPLVAIVLSQVALIARLEMLQGMTGLNMRMYLRKVYLRAAAAALMAGLVPLLWRGAVPSGWGGFLANLALTLLWTLIVVAMVGVEKDELKFLVSKIKR